MNGMGPELEVRTYFSRAHWKNMKMGLVLEDA